MDEHIDYDDPADHIEQLKKKHAEELAEVRKDLADEEAQHASDLKDLRKEVLSEIRDRADQLRALFTHRTDADTLASLNAIIEYVLDEGSYPDGYLGVQVELGLL